MFQSPEKPLIDILEEAGMLTDEQNVEARARLELATRPEDADEILQHYLSATAFALAKKSADIGVPCISLRERLSDPDATAKMRASYAYKVHVVPVQMDGDTLVVAMADPLDVELVDEVRLVSGHDVRPLLALSEEIEDAIRRYYGKSAEDLIRGELTGPAGVVALESVEEIHDFGLQADALVRDPTVVEAVHQIIIDAVRERASDIHIEPFEREVHIRYRIDGVLERRPSPPKHLQPAITSRVKLMAKMNIAETRRPQDGKIPLRIASLGRREIDLRVSTVPTVWGESVVMRILDKNVTLRGLRELGLMDDQYDLFQQMIHKPYGIVLSTGPTGSGKTTTLNTCLREINDNQTKIITVEEPVEYDLEGVNQIDVNPDIGVTFAAALRHILRQDPDKIMVGEIRDLETAEMAVHSALTGHLVFSSLHTNDAPSAITRWIDMGIEPYLVASTLEGIIAQRLPRRVCPFCARYDKPTARELEEMGVEQDTALSDWQVPRAVGCRECRGNGYRGRIGIFEVLVMNPSLREMTLHHASSAQIRTQARKSGMRTLREDGWRKIVAGYTTVDEIRRFTPEEEPI